MFHRDVAGYFSTVLETSQRWAQGQIYFSERKDKTGQKKICYKPEHVTALFATRKHKIVFKWLGVITRCSIL